MQQQCIILTKNASPDLSNFNICFLKAVKNLKPEVFKVIENLKFENFFLRTKKRIYGQPYEGL